MNRSRLDDSRDSRLTNPKEANNYLGFANFPNQVFRRAMKKGFDFTLMVVGRSGLGKSTFINTLFLAEINGLDEKVVCATKGSTVSIEEKLVKLVENSVTLNLTLVDTPGFGDAVDNTKCWEPIVDYLETKFFKQFSEETRIERNGHLADNCVHLCLYFIEPSGHGLKQLDIELMKQLHGRVNVVPVIAKADCFTKEELKKFKAQINKDIETHDIKLYRFPEIDDEKDEGAKLLASVLPFAVVGSNTLRESNGKKIRFREYPWGVVEVENMEHNDFLPLRDMIIRKNMIDMIDVTRNVHYENFRYRQMENLPRTEGNRDPFTQLEEEKRNRDKELAEKRANLEKVFTEKTTGRRNRNEEKLAQLTQQDRENQQKLEEKRLEILRLRGDIEELRRGNLTSSLSSLSTTYSENLSATLGKSTSPTEKTAKKTSRIGTLGLFNRN